MDKLQTIDLAKVKKMFPDMSEIEMGNDFFLADVSLCQYDNELAEPFRVNAYMAIICIEGEMDVEINLRAIHIERRMAFIYIPGNILQIRNVSKDGRYIIMALSEEYMSTLNLDLKGLFNDSMTILSTPYFTLTDEELKLSSGYAMLARELIRMEAIRDRKEALGALIVSVYYALGYAWKASVLKERRVSGLSLSPRNKAIFDEFSFLVNKHHGENRTLSFYADMMHITPKYLSRVIKQVSGRTATEWIDSFVVLEAKNMLRHSDLSIKEIMAQLNFSSHAVFHTFFKKHTGMTPTEYRHSR
ncbi:MAG: AraC family transcriptional regulator [Bacteroidales bacterium]|nr:AraC family transcriptional regulator [Bacteroidales bacterium]